MLPTLHTTQSRASITNSNFKKIPRAEGLLQTNTWKKEISHLSSSQKQFVLFSNDNIILLNSVPPPEADNVFRAIFKHAAMYSNTSLNNSPALSPHWRTIGVLDSTRSLRETNGSAIKCKPVISHGDPWSLYFSFVFIPGRQIWGIPEKDNIPPSNTQEILDTSKTEKLE